MQTPDLEGIEDRPREILQPMIHQDIFSTTNDPFRQAQNVQKLQKQQQLLMVDTLGQLHHYVGPENIPELEAIHASAPTTAVVYVTSVLLIYLLGLLVILVHHMNSAYGPWAWSLADARDELRPLWSWAKRKREEGGSSPRRNSTTGQESKEKSQKRARFANEFEENDFPDEILTPKTVSCPQHTSAIVHAQDVSTCNVDVITSASDPGPNYDPKFSLQSSGLKAGIIQRLQIGYTKFRPSNGIIDQGSIDDQVNITLANQTRRLTNCSIMSHDIASVHDVSPPIPESDESVGVIEPVNLYINSRAEDILI